MIDVDDGKNSTRRMNGGAKERQERRSASQSMTAVSSESSRIFIENGVDLNVGLFRILGTAALDDYLRGTIPGSK